jgi:hypothetical protein
VPSKPVVAPIVVLLKKTWVEGKGSPVCASVTFPLIVWAKETEPRIKNRKSETIRFFRRVILGFINYKLIIRGKKAFVTKLILTRLSD